MKLNLLSLLTLLISLTINAQTEKGKFRIGAFSNGFFTSTSNKFGGETFNKTKTYSLSPSGGYFVADNFSVGLDIELSRSTTKTRSGSQEDISAQIIVSPSFRYYFTKNKLRPYFNASIGIGTDWRETKNENNFNRFGINNSEKQEFSIFTYRLGTGLALFLNNKISIDLGLTFVKLEFEDQLSSDFGESEADSIEVIIGFNIFL